MFRDQNPIALSNKAGLGLTEIQEILEPGKTYCLLGSSGVGKTTLLNNLIGEHTFKTGEVRRKDSRGRHITSSRQLSILENGSLIVDNPGMRELGNIEIDEGLDETYSDIANLSRKCHFKNCTHTNEPDCAILQAVLDGDLDPDQVQNYLKIKKESNYYAMSYVEKRQKDRKLGKFYKSVLKSKKAEKQF
jgi:ribosome biogenesis GTPase